MATLLKTSEVAARLAISVRQVQQLAAEHALGHVKVGRLLRFTEAMVEEFIQVNTVPSTLARAPEPVTLKPKSRSGEIGPVTWDGPHQRHNAPRTSDRKNAKKART